MYKGTQLYDSQNPYQLCDKPLAIQYSTVDYLFNYKLAKNYQSDNLKKIKKKITEKSFFALLKI